MSMAGISLPFLYGRISPCGSRRANEVGGAEAQHVRSSYRSLSGTQVGSPCPDLGLDNLSPGPCCNRACANVADHGQRTRTAAPNHTHLPHGKQTGSLTPGAVTSTRFKCHEGARPELSCPMLTLVTAPKSAARTCPRGFTPSHASSDLRGSAVHVHCWVWVWVWVLGLLRSGPSCGGGHFFHVAHTPVDHLTQGERTTRTVKVSAAPRLKSVAAFSSTCGLEAWPCSPRSVRVTLADVPAPRTLDVCTCTVYTTGAGTASATPAASSTLTAPAPGAACAAWSVPSRTPVRGQGRGRYQRHFYNQGGTAQHAGAPSPNASRFMSGGGPERGDRQLRAKRWLRPTAARSHRLPQA